MTIRFGERRCVEEFKEILDDISTEEGDAVDVPAAAILALASAVWGVAYAVDSLTNTVAFGTTGDARTAGPLETIAMILGYPGGRAPSGGIRDALERIADAMEESEER